MNSWKLQILLYIYIYNYTNNTNIKEGIIINLYTGKFYKLTYETTQTSELYIKILQKYKFNDKIIENINHNIIENHMKNKKSYDSY